MPKIEIAYLKPSVSEDALAVSISRSKKILLKRSDRNKAFSILLGLAIPILFLLFARFQLEAATHEYGAALQVATVDLSISKVATPESVAAGEQVTYTVTVRNEGTLTATNVVLSDSLPSGLASARWSTNVNGATCSDGAEPIVCQLGDLEAGASALITLVVDVDPAITGSLINSAEVSSDIGEDDVSNNAAAASLTVFASADLSLVKTAHAGLVLAGTPVTYTLTISNAGPSDAPGVTVIDELPRATTYISGDGALCSRHARTVTCVLASPLQAGTSTAITLVFGINTEVNGQLTNTAEVSSDVPDDSPGDNVGSVTIIANSQADLSLVKTVSSDEIFPGGRLTYTLTIENAGPTAADNVVISDTLPPGTSFVSASGASCSEVNNLLACSIPSVIDANANAVVTVVVDVDATTEGTLTNHAVVSSNAAGDPPANNQDSVEVTVKAKADLTLVKTASSDNVFPGDHLTYTLTVENAGPSAADNVVISDTLPPGTSFVSAGGASCMDFNNLVTCSLPGSIAAGANTAFTLVVNIDSAASGTVINTAEVHSDAADDSMAANLDSASTLILHRTHRMFLPLMPNGYETGEPNDICEQAFGISPNEIYHFLPEDIFDWYEFNLTTPGNMTIELTNFTPNLGQVAAYKSTDCANRKAGFLGNSGDPGTTKILDLGQQSPGHYYLFVGSDGPLSDTVPYGLRVFVEPTGQ